jgi:Tol biopolymer transport system component
MRPTPSNWLALGLLSLSSATARAQSCGSPPLQMLLVSRRSDGTQIEACALCKNNSHPSCSSDARFVAFSSDSASVETAFPNPQGIVQAYVRDLNAVGAVLVSRNPSTGELGNGASDYPRVSGDGGSIVFASDADNLVEADSNGEADVFLATRSPFTLRRLTQLAGGAELDGGSFAPDLSFDGKTAAYACDATNLAPLMNEPAPQLDGRAQIVVQRVSLQRFRVASLTASGALSNGVASVPRLDAPGTRVAFVTTATDMGFADANGSRTDIYVRDLLTDELLLVSASATDPHRTGVRGSRKPAISADGLWVAFESEARDLIVQGDTNDVQDVFVRGLETGVTVRVSVDPSGGEALAASGYAALSADGRFVAFTSMAANLAPCTMEHLQCFVHDRDLDGNGVFDEPGQVSTRPASASPSTGAPANGKSGGNCALSADGRFVVFMSEGDNLVVPDLNGQCSNCFGRDVFRARLP